MKSIKKLLSCSNCQHHYIKYVVKTGKLNVSIKCKKNRRIAFNEAIKCPSFNKIDKNNNTCKTEVMTIKKAAEMLQLYGNAVAERTLRSWCQNKTIKAEKVRRNKFTKEWLIPFSEIAKFLIIDAEQD